MLEAAKGLIRTQFMDVVDDPDTIVAEFKRRFYDTKLFHDKYAGGKFAQYLLGRHADKAREFSAEKAHHLLEETQLFIEAAYACHAKLLEQGVVAPALGGQPAATASV
jgi:sulfite reductase (ferredoxin)